MSAKTGVYETWKMLELIEEQAPTRALATEQLNNFITERRAEVEESTEGDEELANDMGYTLQLGLLKTVLALLQKP